MTHKKDAHHENGFEHARTVSPDVWARVQEAEVQEKFELVLKCDTFGSVEAVSSAIMKIHVPGVKLRIIQSGVGDVSKSDLLMALTGSRMVAGFNVGVMPKGEQWVKEHGGEVRLYNVIFRLVEDLKRVAQSLLPVQSEERITARATIIALFKTSHRAGIVGCEVQDGVLAVGKPFRIISAMGPVYSGRIESLQIDRKSVREAKIGQQVGIKIQEFDKARVGDLVECFETTKESRFVPWKPSGSILNLEESS